MEVAALDAVARMPAQADLHQRIARLAAEGRRLALPFQADRLAVLDIGRQLDRDLAPVREKRRHLGRGRHLLHRDVQRHVEVCAARRGLLALRAGTGPRTLPGKGVAENLAEDVARRVALLAAHGTAAAELEMRPAGAGLPAAEA